MAQLELQKETEADAVHSIWIFDKILRILRNHILEGFYDAISLEGPTLIPIIGNSAYVSAFNQSAISTGGKSFARVSTRCFLETVQYIVIQTI